jgi:hypothetical protein
LSKLEKGKIGSWEELTKQFTSNFKSTYKRPASIEEVKAYVKQRNETLRAYIQRWSIIKNSAVEVSDERAIDAFTLGLCRWISCRKNTGYHATDPKIRTQGAEHGRSWIATKHGDESLESSNAQRTAERDAELYPGSGPSW